MFNLAICNMAKATIREFQIKISLLSVKIQKLNYMTSMGDPENKPLPKFDAIIGNPPYTRQEDIGTMQGTVGKETVQPLLGRNVVLNHHNGLPFMLTFFITQVCF